MNLKKHKFFLVLGGIVLGVLGLIFANAAMVLSDSRPFCGTCHIMQQASFTQKNSSHATLSCNECHAPHTFVNKILFKAKAGAKDIWSNTFENPEFIVTTEDTKKIVNDNCKRCHFSTNKNVASMNAKETCVSCHRNIPHMRMKEITTREIGDV